MKSNKPHHERKSFRKWALTNQRTMTQDAEKKLDKRIRKYLASQIVESTKQANILT